MLIRFLSPPVRMEQSSTKLTNLSQGSTSRDVGEHREDRGDWTQTQALRNAGEQDGGGRRREGQDGGGRRQEGQYSAVCSPQASREGVAAVSRCRPSSLSCRPLKPRNWSRARCLSSPGKQTNPGLSSGLTCAQFQILSGSGHCCHQDLWRLGGSPGVSGELRLFNIICRFR